MMAATMIPIQSITLTGSAASVTFSAIPQTYTDLVLRMTIRDSDTTNLPNALKLSMNAISGSAHSNTAILANGSTGGISTRSSNQPAWTNMYYATSHASSTANTFTPVEAYISGYADTRAKIGAMDVGYIQNNTAPYLGANAGLFNASTAISAIVVTPAGGNWLAGCTFHLYGIKNS